MNFESNDEKSMKSGVNQAKVSHFKVEMTGSSKRFDQKNLESKNATSQKVLGSAS